MKSSVAILCCGPSLPQTWKDDGRYRAIIGVNRAPIKYLCDFWCYADFNISQDNSMRAMGHPTIFCPQDQAEASRTKGFPIRTWETLDSGLSAKQKQIVYHPTYSTIWALMLARDLGAKRIELFGADMKGEEEFDGEKSPLSVRTPERWDREKCKLINVTEWFETEGIAVERVLP